MARKRGNNFPFVSDTLSDRVHVQFALWMAEHGAAYRAVKGEIEQKFKHERGDLHRCVIIVCDDQFSLNAEPELALAVRRMKLPSFPVDVSPSMAVWATALIGKSGDFNSLTPRTEICSVNLSSGTSRKRPKRQSFNLDFLLRWIPIDDLLRLVDDFSQPHPLQLQLTTALTELLEHNRTMPYRFISTLIIACPDLAIHAESDAVMTELQREQEVHVVCQSRGEDPIRIALWTSVVILAQQVYKSHAGIRLSLDQMKMAIAACGALGSGGLVGFPCSPIQLLEHVDVKLPVQSWNSLPVGIPTRAPDSLGGGWRIRLPELSPSTDYWIDVRYDNNAGGFSGGIDSRNVVIPLPALRTSLSGEIRVRFSTPSTDSSPMLFGPDKTPILTFGR